MNTLTPSQKLLADLLISTKTQAKVRRRAQLPDGSYSFTEVIRDTSPIDFAQEGEFALKLHEQTPGAPLSPIYINLRNLPENILDQIGIVLSEIQTEMKPDFCTGIPEAGIPLVKAYSKVTGVPIVDIFTKEQTDEGRRIVSGEDKEKVSGKIRIIDDLVTKAGTKLEAVEAAKNAGYEVLDILVIVDREQGGAIQLAEQGINLKSALTLSQLLDYYLETGKISQEHYDKVKEYQANNS